jgi:hypothetical protein
VCRRTPYIAARVRNHTEVVVHLKPQACDGGTWGRNWESRKGHIHGARKYRRRSESQLGNSSSATAVSRLCQSTSGSVWNLWGPSA